MGGSSEVPRRARGRCTTPRAPPPGFEPAGTCGCLFFSRMTQVALPLGVEKGWLAEWWTRTAGPVAPCPVLGCVVAVAGIAEVPWEAPWRPFPLAGNLFEECIIGPPWSGLVFMLLSDDGGRAGLPACFSFTARWLKPSQRPWEDTCGAEIYRGEIKVRFLFCCRG